VFNILDHKKEVDRIVFEDSDPKTGFILLPDLKWDGKTVSNLYLVAIVHEKGIQSLRDLTPEHIPLLQNVLNAGCVSLKLIFEKKGIGLPLFLYIFILFVYIGSD
jgi:m7GpppX diphosphatase